MAALPGWISTDAAWAGTIVTNALARLPSSVNTIASPGVIRWSRPLEASNVATLGAELCPGCRPVSSVSIQIAGNGRMRVNGANVKSEACRCHQKCTDNGCDPEVRGMLMVEVNGNQSSFAFGTRRDQAIASDICRTGSRLVQVDTALAIVSPVA